MTVHRTRRLEQLLGASPAEATYDPVRTLVANQIPEAFDLDYKRDLYGNTEPLPCATTKEVVDVDD
ncbi:hypothetical protein ACFQZ2_05830 [Streptomonospora algeriensis]|uniref:Uncharacterized protein n=1 Tax=Streptomonospora algeriensis TaxID=995084 RepID=A0ABW3B9C0_9ACTN